MTKKENESVKEMFLNKKKSYEPKRVCNFYSNYMEYESNNDRVKNYRLKNRLIKLTILKDIINNLKTSVTWKIQLTLAINFIF